MSGFRAFTSDIMSNWDILGEQPTSGRTSRQTPRCWKSRSARGEETNGRGLSEKRADLEGQLRDELLQPAILFTQVPNLVLPGPGARFDRRGRRDRRRPLPVPRTPPVEGLLGESMLLANGAHGLAAGDLSQDGEHFFRGEFALPRHAEFPHRFLEQIDREIKARSGHRTSAVMSQSHHEAVARNIPFSCRLLGTHPTDVQPPGLRFVAPLRQYSDRDGGSRHSRARSRFAGSRYPFPGLSGGRR